MNKFFIVFKHSFLTNCKKKSFIISTLVTLLLIILLFNLPNILSNFEDNEPKQIGVIDLTEMTFEQLNQQISIYDDINLVSFSNESDAKTSYDEGNIYGYLIINFSEENLLDVTYKASNIVNTDFINRLEQSLNQIQFQSVANTLELSQNEINKLFMPINMERVPLDKNAKSQEEIVQSYVLVYIILFAIYFGVIMYGNMVAMEVAKEKSSRIMEILISSVNPIAQMFGKILGISLLGIIQIVLIILVGFISVKTQPESFEIEGMMLDFSNIPVNVIIFGVIFYILGYLFFASIAAMLGSLVSRIEDMQQMIGLLNLILVTAFMIAMFGLSNPDTTFIVITSFIPIFTPMIMFLRIGMSDPSMWEIIISIGIMIASITIISIFAAKVFRGGVLMYGKSNYLKDIKKALALHKD